MNTSSIMEQHKKAALKKVDTLPFPQQHYGSGISTDISHFSSDQFLKQTKNKKTLISTKIPASIKFYDLSTVPSSIIQYLATLSLYDEHKINALHYASLQQLIVIIIPKNTACSEPIIINESAFAGAFSTHYLIIAEENSTASIQSTINSSKKTTFLTSQVELFLHPSAAVNFYTTYALDSTTMVYRNQCIKQQQQSNAHIFDFIQNGKHCLHQTTALLQGSYASFNHLLGVKAMQNAQYTIFSSAHHAAEHTQTSLQCKSIIADTSKVLFRGSLTMEKEASFSEGKQQADLLLIGEKAIGEAIPLLDVHTNEVTCSHGASITKIDDQKIFYLTTRGLSEDQAKKVITGGFLTQITQLFPQLK